MKINELILENKASLSSKEIEDLIRYTSKKYGIDPDIAVKVWKSEGGTAYQSTLVPSKGSKTKTHNGKEASFGPFQLYIGGGLGNDYENKYGVDIKDDNTPEGLRRQIEFSLQIARKKGWSPWYGAKNANIGKWQGIDFSDVQQSIKNSGIEVDVDGVYGPKTQQAIINFQKNNGLDADGIIGPKTRAALDKFTTTNTNTNTNTEPEKVDNIPAASAPAGSTSAPATSIRPTARPTSAAPATSIRPTARPTSAAPATSIRPAASAPAGSTSAPATSIRPTARPTSAAPATSIRPTARPDSGISTDTKKAIDKIVKKVVNTPEPEEQEVDNNPNVMTTVPKLAEPNVANNGKSGMPSKSKGSTNKKTESTIPTEITLEETQDFHEEFGYLGYSEDDNDLFEAEYQGRTVKLNKPMRGDVKKFKVYVKNDKGNVIKVNFGHGGTSAKSKGEKTMKIRKSNPKARKSFRARHNCDNPGPKTKARYWSCRAW